VSKTYVYSYNPGSQGAKELAQALNVKRLRHHGSQVQLNPGDRVICWGSSGDRVFPGGVQLCNPKHLVARASNKLAFFQHLVGTTVQVPEWTSDPVIARGWVDSGHIVVARTVLSGHSGEGIQILGEGGVDFVSAPLYTKYVKKEAEYRVHCAFGGCIDLQRKIKRPDFVGVPNWRVRNHQNGFIYVRNNVQAPEEVKAQALEAFVQSGLDFGAVDVLWNQGQGKAYVLEINTAPGITGTTVASYSQAFKQALNLP
jgi:hypothetical protein